MKKKYSTQLTKPLALFLVVVGCLFSLLVLRLLDLQLARGTYFRTKADGNRFYTKYLPAQRGVFLDRFSDPLVVNTPKYYVLEDGTSLYSPRIPVSHSEALEAMAENPDAVEFDIERHYLFPESLSHTQGYVGAVTAEDLEKNSSLSIASRIGKMGLERWFNAETSGQPGSVTYEINALGHKQRTVEKNPGIAGSDIATTLDPYLSEIAFRALGDQRGSVVIMDADTGAVLSLVSAPPFNSSTMSRTGVTVADEVVRKEQVASYFSNPLKPFFNRSISGVYPPGSVFKLLTALAGLEKGVVDRETTIIDEGVLDIGEYSYANWYFTQYGRVEGEINITRSIARSNDIFFYKTAGLIGPTGLAETAQLFGLGSRTGIELPGEAPGLVPTPEWKEQAVGEKWFLGNTFHMGIGQGDLLASPLQMASVIQALSKRGARCQPYLSLETSEDGRQLVKRCTELGVKEDHLELVVEGMLDACSTGGTAFPFFPHNQVNRDTALDPYEQVTNGAIACKTGTSEYGGANQDGYRNTHGWFAVFFSQDTKMRTALQEEAQTLEESSQSLTATASATVSGETQQGESALVATPVAVEKKTTAADYSIEELYHVWAQKVVHVDYPKNIVIITLVESDEAQPFKEGSRDAAPVAEKIYGWMSGSFFEE